MADGIRLDVRGLDTLQYAIRLFPAYVEREMTRDMHRATQQLEGHIKPLTPVDLGALRSSYGSEVKSVAEGVHGIMGTNNEYAPFVEYGTKPHFPPISAIEGWAHRHGIPPFLVARAIARRGTKAVKMFERTFRAQRRPILAMFRQTVGRIVARFGR